MSNRFCLIIFLFLSISFLQAGEKSLRVNLICYKNGVGLNKDIEILDKELTALGHNVNFTDSSILKPIEKADINVFLDVFEEFFFPYGQKNYYVPNPEWCFLSPEKIAKFDLILCKTKEAERIFKPLNRNTVYLGFTSKDHYNKDTRKNFKLALHLVGASIQKGTKPVVDTWLNNPQFPLIYILRHKGNLYIPETHNIKLMKDYLSENSLLFFQNSCGLHLCPSETEGFGHYIMEALSCGNVVVTTDAPPMNEFITDKRCLIKTTRSEPWRMAIRHFVDPLNLDSVISNLLSLPDEELEIIGKRNREFYLSHNQIFKTNLAEIFNANSPTH